MKKRKAPDRTPPRRKATRPDRQSWQADGRQNAPKRDPNQGAGRRTAPFILRRTDVARATAMLPPYWRPVLVGVRDGHIGFATVMQGEDRFRVPPGLPIVLLLGDDFETSRGPAGFHDESVRKFVECCGAAVIVACAAKPDFYAAAAVAAVAIRLSVVLVETQAQHEADWVDCFQRIKPGLPTLLGSVRPPSGAQH